MSSWRLVATLFLFSHSAFVAAGEMRYAASLHQSYWEVNASRLHCSLSHDIPAYGRAVFERSAGGELDFRLEVWRRPHQVGVARLLSTAPAWKHDSRVRDLGQVSYAVERSPFQLRGIMARRLLLELERGMFPTFSYQDWADGRDEIRVALSAVNIRGALQEFLHCLDNQLPYTYDDVRDSRIIFGFDSTELSAAARQRLEQIADYLLEDPAVRKVVLEGRTDSTGYRRYNQALAQRRVEAVRGYLAARGVAPGQFATRTRGERRPLASNRTPQGRALNRSVQVTLTK
jgi:outer membrane protein OmpA-like peptidoglycan-associated protein